MKLIYKKYLTKATLIWAGCFVLLFLVYLLVLAPQKRTKKQVEKLLAEKKQMYDSVLKATQQETRNQLNEQLERLRNRLKDFVIDYEDSANLTFDISKIANEKKVNSFSIKNNVKKDRSGTTTPEQNYIRENYIDVSFTGDFNQFAALLNALERHRPIVFVDKFVITRPKHGRSAHDVNMDLAVFVRKRQDG